MNDSLQINTKKETEKIIKFLRTTFREQGIKNGVIAVSGGIDSGVSLSLLSRSINKNNITVLHLPYFDEDDDVEDLMESLGIHEDQLVNMPIDEIVDDVCEQLDIAENDLVRRGNIMARIRMIILFDFSKQNNALVVGTENKSEYYLGYFTRFGDEASDIEPIASYYKTQIYELAKYLKVPKSILIKQPSANLWEEQTDEKEFGFSYEDADPILYLHFDEGKSIQQIERLGYKNAKKVIEFAMKNSFKHKVPYKLPVS